LARLTQTQTAAKKSSAKWCTGQCVRDRRYVNILSIVFICYSRTKHHHAMSGRTKRSSPAGGPGPDRVALAVADRLSPEVGRGHAEAHLDVQGLAKETRKSANWHGRALNRYATSIYVSRMLDHGGQTVL
jgi:hypothetical protein